MRLRRTVDDEARPGSVRKRRVPGRGRYFSQISAPVDVLKNFCYWLAPDGPGNLMLLRFAGFELDSRRAELRTSGGDVIKLRPKNFEMLALLAAHPGRICSKQELMETVWPNVHVGDGSLFQCIGEIRTALGDEDRKIVKLVSGRGYRFDAEVSTEALDTPSQIPPAEAAVAPAAAPAKNRRLFGLSGPTALAAVAVLTVAFGLAIAAPMFGPDLFKQRSPAIAVMPVTGADADAAPTAGPSRSASPTAWRRSRIFAW